MFSAAGSPGLKLVNVLFNKGVLYGEYRHIRVEDYINSFSGCKFLRKGGVVNVRVAERQWEETPMYNSQTGKFIGTSHRLSDILYIRFEAQKAQFWFTWYGHEFAYLQNKVYEPTVGVSAGEAEDFAAWHKAMEPRKGQMPKYISEFLEAEARNLKPLDITCLLLDANL